MTRTHCSACGKIGHRRNQCAAKRQMTKAEWARLHNREAYRASLGGKLRKPCLEHRCTGCDAVGHNRRTCQARITLEVLRWQIDERSRELNARKARWAYERRRAERLNP